MFSEKVPEEKEDLWIEFVREWMSRDPDAGGHSCLCLRLGERDSVLSSSRLEWEEWDVGLMTHCVWAV